jgi:spermidine synthase
MGQVHTGAGPVAPGTSGLTRSLFLISLLGLFLELMLIRWISTEIRIFAYLQNTVLVVCFLGLGMGCWTCRKPFVLRDVLLPLGLLVFLLAFPPTRVALGRISDWLSYFGDLVIWGPSFTGSPWQTAGYTALGLGLTCGLMVLIWDIFVPIGRLMGRLLDEPPNTIWAYSVNVGGSLVGIWLFVLLSVLYQPPLTWFLVTAGLLVCFIGPRGWPRRVDLALLAGILGLAWLAGREPGALEVCWSPYQKLTLWQVDPHTSRVVQGSDSSEASLWEREVPHQGIGDYLVQVNNCGYQAMIDLNPEHTRADPQRYPPEMDGLSQYDLPALLHPNPRKLLAVGAGTGNDVAGALRHGVPDVVAVEIDPAILDLGRRFHPEHPYDSPAVRLVNDDARSYFATSTERFDVISFGLLDSHTTTAMTNARLDHYVYTRESLRQAKSLLADGGVIVLSFEAQKPFIADRMARALEEVFGRPPLCFRVPLTAYGWGGVFFVAGDLDAAERQIAANPRLAAQIATWQQANPVPLPGTAPVTTDDWPYVYLEGPWVPSLYYLLGGLLLVLFARGVWQLKVPDLVTGWGRTHWHFFFLGVAFMLLEVQNISKASVVLGNTWWVNAVIISGILAMILLANWVAARFPRMPLAPVYAALCAACVVLYFVDLSRFGFLPYATKAALVGGLTSLPMLFSGIIFIRSFAGVARKDAALGANLMGALAGGLLQSLTFVTGIKALLLLVAGFYLIALLTRPRAAAAVTTPTPAPAPSG